MTKEEALKVLDTIPTIGEQVDALEMAIEALEQTRWIPVSERLPEEKQSVLVWCPQYQNIYCAYLEREQWWIFGGAFVQIVPNEVIAWMPLPESYKAEEDCISRAELLSRIDAERKHLLDLKMDGAEHIIVHHARRIIEELPSVTPQPKVGEWLEKEVNSDKVIEEWQSARCSVCDRYHTTPYMYYFDDYKFCPNCGARMEVET